jgi:Na+/phosphate symporter
MKDKRFFVNPFRMISRKLDNEAFRIEELHEKAFSESMSIEEGLLVMISKIIEEMRLLSKCVLTGSQSLMSAAEVLGHEVHEEEKVLTKKLLDAKLKVELLKGVIRFPFRLERIGDMLGNMLNCCSLKARDGIPFSDKAQAELEQLFSMATDMLMNLRDVFVVPNRTLIEHILAQGGKLAQMLLEFRLNHWERLEAGYCAPQASSLYLDILDSFTAINEYVEKMCRAFLDLEEVGVTAPPDGRRTERR